MPCLRCSLCGNNWPVDETYSKCPVCEEPTSPVSNVAAMSKRDAASLANHAIFDRFYEEWDESHPPQRLATDGLRDYAPEPPAKPGTAVARVA